MCWTFWFVRTKYSYNSVKTVPYGALKTHTRCMKVLCIRQNLCIMRSVSKTICGNIVLWRDVYVYNVRWLSSLVCWKRINGVPGLPRRAHTANTTAAFLQKFFGVLIISRGLGHRDHQTSRHLTTSFWRDFLKIESVAITQKARRTLNVTLQRLLQTLAIKLLKKMQDTAKGRSGTLSASAGIRPCLSHCWYIWIIQ